MKLARPVYLTDSALHLAHCCAVEIWQGYNYGKNQKVKEPILYKDPDTSIVAIRLEVISDEFLLAELFYHLQKNSMGKRTGKHPIVDESFIDVFRKVARIKSTDRRRPKPDIQTGLEYIKTKLWSEYRTCLKTTGYELIVSSYELADSLSCFLTDQLISKNYSDHLMLANRILFFLCPELPIYNYSPSIASMLGCSGNVNEHYLEYQVLNAEEIQRNWYRLSRFEMPLSSLLSEEDYDTVRESGWWQRRVFDLALKFASESKKTMRLSTRVQRRFLIHSSPNIV
jgi:hypothetical protein